MLYGDPKALLDAFENWTHEGAFEPAGISLLLGTRSEELLRMVVEDPITGKLHRVPCPSHRAERPPPANVSRSWTTFYNLAFRVDRRAVQFARPVVYFRCSFPLQYARPYSF